MSTTRLPDSTLVAEGRAGPAPGGMPVQGAPWRRLVRGRPDDPPWVRLALVALLAGTGILYFWGLHANGNGNTFYAAAVQAGTKSWRAFFFGSFDSSSFITVDKPPASLWVMALSGRIFGFNAWSMLVPQALEGVAAVGLLYAAVRRWYGSAAGLLAGSALALSPVAAQMFRYNNPDALLTLLLVAAAYATCRAIEAGRAGWLALAGLLIGFGFLTKMLEALLVVPALALAYLVAAPVSFWRRVRDLAVAGAVLVLGAGWWVAAVALTPAADRPFVGGSTNNSVLQLAFGYNGLSRITGNRRGGGAPAALRDVQAEARRFASFGFGGQRGLTRMFSGSWATDAGWLIPAALITLVVGLWLTRRAPRTDVRRAGLLLFGGWMLVSALVFSYASGIVHEYYSVAMAPAVGALVAIGATMLWSRRESWVGRAGLSAMVAATGIWAFVLLDRTPHWNPWLRFVIVAVALLGIAGILGGSLTRRRLALPVGSLALAATLLGPAAYSAEAAFASHGGGGAILAAGPGAAQGRLPAALGREAAEFAERNGFAFAFGSGGNLRPAGEGGNGGLGRGAGGFIGGRDGPQTVSSAVVSRLEAGASQYRWVAATTSAPQAAPFELATGKPVMAIGGFMGTDNAITLQAFQQLVREGKVHYFIGGGFGPGAGAGGVPGAAPGAEPAGTRGGAPAGFGGFGGFRGGTSSDAGQIATWVTQHYQPQTVGGTTLYDLTAPNDAASR
ncbi:MAG TPA: glycosyltransferase family 39 protein [Actinomycetota bacterium]